MTLVGEPRVAASSQPVVLLGRIGSRAWYRTLPSGLVRRLVRRTRLVVPSGVRVLSLADIGASRDGLVWALVGVLTYAQYQVS